MAWPAFMISMARILESCSEDKSIIVWDIDTGSAKFTLRGHSKDNSECICEFWRNGNLKSSNPDCPVSGHSGWVWCVAFSTDDNFLISGGDGGELFMWDAKTGNHLGALTGHSSAVTRLAISGNVDNCSQWLCG